MTDFLLELRSEEIPARMQAKAREDLARLFTAELATAGLKAERIETYATPRRLALIAHGLPDQTEATAEELKGPRTAAPPQALEGFLRKTGLTQDQLVDRDGVYYAVIDKPGRATAEVLAAAIPAIVRAFPWPKSMRWGAASISTESLRWVRPLLGIVALLGHTVVPCAVAGIESGRTTVGHRFHAPADIAIDSAATYAEQLRAAHVIVDQHERATLIRTRATALAAEAGLELIEDEGLVAENAGLTEWPVPLLGRFDEAFLDVPAEVIQLTARVNQKYFVCKKPPRHGEGDHAKHGGGGPASSGTLANAFICTANIDATDGGAKIVEGNRKVLAARLADAKFFYDTDLKVKLEDQAKKLEKIVFHEKLGTVADKVDRVAKLARWLVKEGIINPSPLQGRGTESEANRGEGDAAEDGVTGLPLSPTLSPEGERERLADLTYRAARLAKADLVTGMVGEFPELQGVMGGYYARAQGEDPRVADAIRDHYKPVGQGDDVPADPVTVAVSLADKLDTITSFFYYNMAPTGSKDPFALRRSSLGIISIITRNGLRLNLIEAIKAQQEAYSSDVLNLELASDLYREAIEALNDPNGYAQFYGKQKLSEVMPLPEKAMAALQAWIAMVEGILDFFADRLKVQQREAGVRHDLIDAVFALGGEDDLVRLLARVHALQAFITTDDGANLLAGYKRAANILKKEGVTPLPAGEGGARSAEPSGRVRAAEVAPDRPHPSGPAGLPPSPDGRGKSLSYTPEIAETALIAALDSAEPRAAAAVGAEDFAGAMAALATLRAPIDAFFDSVTVNDADLAKRTARLALLNRVRAAVHSVADFSRIEG